MGRYCPICWTERRIRHIVADVRYWWKYSVLKKPKPDYDQVVKQLIPLFMRVMIGMEILDEMAKVLEDDDGRVTRSCEKDKEL